jgi:predicted RNase H-like HicB family nuclease
MEIPVIIEPIAENGYQASSGAPLGLTAQGPTREEALQRLQELLRNRLEAGVQIVSVSVASQPPAPWARFAGALRGDPLLPAWRQAMADYRKKMEEDPDVP